MSQVTSNTSMALDCSLTSRRILQVAIYINAVTCLDFITATHGHNNRQNTKESKNTPNIISRTRQNFYETKLKT